MNKENIIKELHDARRYLEDKEWSDRCASSHIDAINNALALLKEQEVVKPVLNEQTENICNKRNARIFACKECGYGINDIYLTDESNYQIEPVFCPNCGRKVVQ